MKKNILKNNQRILISLASFSLILLVGVTLAVIYFSRNFENKFLTNAYNVQIEEEFYGEFGTKKVSITNNDNTPLILRVSYNELWSMQGSAMNSTSCKVSYMELEDEQVLVLSNKINGEDVVIKEWTSAWENDFLKGNDGWYYYKKVLNKNDSVQILNSIQLNKELISDGSCYQNYNDFQYGLDFNYEVIQATEGAVQEIWNRNIKITGSDITWDF